MRIAVLSGKGGAGKTLSAVNLAAAAGKAVYIDCDVEEPNGRLFLQPETKEQSSVCIRLPEFDAAKCTGCRKCVDFCRFHALIYIKEKPKVFSEVCHSCGGCLLVCPQGAAAEKEKPVGHIERGMCGGVKIVTGVLNPGEASGVPVIRAALEAERESGGLTVIDCPPGSACTVMESIADADYCILVAEPTAFGFHNFRMVHELSALLRKPCGVIINKMEEPYEPLERFCGEHGLPVLLRLPFSKEIAEMAAAGKLLVGSDDGAYQEMFREVLKKIGGED